MVFKYYLRNMKTGLAGKLLFFCVITGIVCCKTLAKKNAPLYTADNEAKFRLKSSCKNSSFITNNTDSMQATILRIGKESVNKLKLRTTGSLKKAGYRILRTELT